MKELIHRCFPTARSRWMYAFIAPWIIPLMAYLLIGRPYLQNWSNFLGGTLVVGILSTVAFVAHNYAADVITRRYPHLRQTVKRIIWMTLSFTFLTAFFLYFYLTLFALGGFFHTEISLEAMQANHGIIPTWNHLFKRLAGADVTPPTLVFLYAVDVFSLLAFVFIYEVFYSLEQWQASQKNKETLKKARLQGQLQSLRSQISPHFLFNSLNSLSSLIADEPQKAEDFVNEMAKVYRYLLQTSERELTPLSVELAFIHSYYHLLKTRYGAGLHLDVVVDPAYLKYQLPPLTLQMLVENAVKHNVILATKPLHIHIGTTTTGELLVSNNLQTKAKRPGVVESTKVGLSNITARYRLLDQPEPQITNGPDHFKILLPLFTENVSDI
ncbi:histidine kinase [Siphonobacter sp. BAB-5405]|uniref:sensor histidine kinase n=1 Tax=Siphonobacter sp. BAB-5405 TaxID=1864825 RepID=UPI000C801677|nr:histidine kinase [Siphonobacter sp. BAB-5405]PMD93236.1 histidine kinase [Siphonobacter sp. BAB-5405]